MSACCKKPGCELDRSDEFITVHDASYGVRTFGGELSSAGYSCSMRGSPATTSVESLTEEGPERSTVEKWSSETSEIGKEPHDEEAVVAEESSKDAKETIDVSESQDSGRNATEFPAASLAQQDAEHDEEQSWSDEDQEGEDKDQDEALEQEDLEMMDDWAQDLQWVAENDPANPCRPKAPLHPHIAASQYDVRKYIALFYAHHSGTAASSDTAKRVSRNFRGNGQKLYTSTREDLQWVFEVDGLSVLGDLMYETLQNSDWGKRTHIWYYIHDEFLLALLSIPCIMLSVLGFVLDEWVLAIVFMLLGYANIIFANCGKRFFSCEDVLESPWWPEFLKYRDWQ
ncbi:MAG: hypothetical protein M4579_003451 [Chaenotheca gracillima]|nr:MAG: hypothetical protein M4579_003451 [Chaenotheca gracillima]